MSYMYYCMVRWKSDPLFRYLKKIVPISTFIDNVFYMLIKMIVLKTRIALFPAKKDDHNMTRAVHLFTVQCGGQYSTLAGLETCNHVLVSAQHGYI